MPRTFTGRAHRPRWALPLAITGGALVAIIAAVTITNAVAGRPNTAAAPTITATATPGTDETAAATGDEKFSAIRGCLAGPDITAEQLAAIRAEENLDPAGAAEFLGAWMQFIGAADPERRDGWWDTLTETSGPAVRSMFAAAGNGTNAYGDSATHSIDLSRSAVQLVEHDPEHVVLDFAGLVLTDGEPTRLDGLAPQYQYQGGRVTLTNAAAGWQVDSFADHESLPAVTVNGVAFTEGC